MPADFAQGDTVEWWKPAGWYDVVYKSRVFTDTYSKDVRVLMLHRVREIRAGAIASAALDDLPGVGDVDVVLGTLFPPLCGADKYQERPQTAGVCPHQFRQHSRTGPLPADRSAT